MAYPNTAPTYEYLDGLNADGTILGQSSAALIGFWGATPSARVAFSAASVSGATTATAFASAIVAELAVLLNEVRAAMVATGLKGD
jgi:hypothetical protein